MCVWVTKAVSTSPKKGTHFLRENSYARVFFHRGGPLSVKLRCNSTTNKHENSSVHVNKPYVTQLHKHFNNNITMEWRRKKKQKLRKKKGIWGKDYGLGSACGGGCQICLPEARCSLAYFIRLNIVLIQRWRANKQITACAEKHTDFSPLKYFIMITTCTVLYKKSSNAHLWCMTYSLWPFLETFTMLLVTEHTANDCRLRWCQGNLLKGHRQNN